jgi:hypothetical protein
MLIYACISGHGYGHGSRSAAVLAELAALRPGWRLVVSTSLAPGFLDLALAGVVHERRPCRWDVGVVQADALGCDGPATLAALEEVAAGWPALVEREARWLAAQGEPVLVLADVPPAAALLAERLGAPLVWLASFGWEAIYAEMGPAFAPWAARCLELYRRGDLLLHCPLSLPMPWGVPELQLGLTASRPRFSDAELRQRLALPAERDRTVLLSFGGLGMDLDPALPARWPDLVFLGPDPRLAEVPNGRELPAGTRPLDWMPLVGRLITKPGYSSFCEAFSQGVGIHLVQRAGFAEAPVLERDLQRYGRHRLLSEAQLRRGDWQLDQPLLEPTHAGLASDGAAVAARAIAERAEGRSEDPIDRHGKV